MIRALLMILCLPVSAANYFIDVGSGSDSNNGTATNTAWAHLPGSIGFTGAGWVTITNGDTITVKGGTTNNVKVQFTTPSYGGAQAFDSITIRSGDLASWGSGRAIFDGQNTRTYGLGLGQGSGAGLYGLTIDGFEIRNIAAGAAGPPWDSSTGSACIEIGGNNAVQYITVKRCWLHAANRTVDNTGHGIEFNGLVRNFIVTQNTVGPAIGTKGIETYNASVGVISNNFISGCGDHCIATGLSTNLDICNNVIFNVPPQVHQPQYGIAFPGAVLCDVWNNLIYRPVGVTNSAGLNWCMGLGEYTYGQHNRIVHNTIAFFSDSGGSVNGGSTLMRIGDGSSTSYQISDLLIANNILYKGSDQFGNIQFNVFQNCVTNDTIIHNDFFGVIPTENVIYKYNGSFTASTVAGFVANTGETFAANVQVYPGLQSGVLPDGLDASYQPNTAYFALTPDTPITVRATGLPVLGTSTNGYSSATNKFSLDISGRTRTLWSMGAYEFPSVVPTVPGPPRNLRVAIFGH